MDYLFFIKKNQKYIESNKMKVKIYGAGSIGNHLANASRQMGWSVDICDVDRSALKRTKNEIYP